MLADWVFVISDKEISLLKYLQILRAIHLKENEKL